MIQACKKTTNSTEKTFKPSASDIVCIVAGFLYMTMGVVVGTFAEKMFSDGVINSTEKTLLCLPVLLITCVIELFLFMKGSVALFILVAIISSAFIFGTYNVNDPTTATNISTGAYALLGTFHIAYGAVDVAIKCLGIDKIIKEVSRDKNARTDSNVISNVKFGSKTEDKNEEKTFHYKVTVNCQGHWEIVCSNCEKKFINASDRFKTKQDVLDFYKCYTNTHSIDRKECPHCKAKAEEEMFKNI